MAKVYITPHGNDAKGWARLSNGQAMAIVGGQKGDCIDLDIGPAANHSAAATFGGLYRIAVDGADCRLRIGKDAVASATGERWWDGDSDIRFLQSGERISVIAVS